MNGRFGRVFCQLANGLSKLFLTIATAFAEAERDRIRERIGQVKADQKARGRYLGGKLPFGYRRGESGELVPHEGEQEAIREIISLRAQGKALRTIADAMTAERPPDQPRGRGRRPKGCKGGSVLDRGPVTNRRPLTFCCPGWTSTANSRKLTIAVR
jgi:hypothetical protein